MTDNSDATPPSAPGEGSGFEPPAAPGSGAYQPPASGGYDAPPPPPAGGYNAPPPSYGAPVGGPGGAPASSDEKTWILIAHFGAIIVGFIAPLVAMLAKGNESAAVKAHSVEALNFQLTWLVIVLVASLVTCGLGSIVIIVPIVFAIIGGVKASNGEFYRYPLSVRVIK